MEESKVDIKLDLDRFPLDGDSGLHVHKGIIHAGFCPPEHLENLDNLNIKSTYWIVATYPKSGTTWMEEIMFLISNDGDTGLTDALALRERTTFLDSQRQTEALNERTGLHRVIKTHLPVSMMPRIVWESNIKRVVVLRNPKDVLVSYYHFYRSCESFGYYSDGWDKFFEMFITGNVMMGSWFSWVKGWYDEVSNNPNVLFMSYEQLKQSPTKGVRHVAKFLGKDLSDDIIQQIVDHTSFETMKQNPNMNFSENKLINLEISPFLRKGIVGDWQAHFNSEQNRIFDMLYEHQMMGYEDITHLILGRD